MSEEDRLREGLKMLSEKYVIDNWDYETDSDEILRNLRHDISLILDGLDVRET